MHWATVVHGWLTLIMSKRGPPSSISILVLQSQTALYSVVKWLLLITIKYLSHCLFVNLFLCGQPQSRLRLRVFSCHRSQQSTRKHHTSSVLSHSVMSSSLDCSLPSSSVHEFSRQEHWNGFLFPPPGDLSDPGIEPDLLCLLHCRWILY